MVFWRLVDEGPKLCAKRVSFCSFGKHWLLGFAVLIIFTEIGRERKNRILFEWIIFLLVVNLGEEKNVKWKLWTHGELECACSQWEMNDLKKNTQIFAVSLICCKLCHFFFFLDFITKRKLFDTKCPNNQTNRSQKTKGQNYEIDSFTY